MSWAEEMGYDCGPPDDYDCHDSIGMSYIDIKKETDKACLVDFVGVGLRWVPKRVFCSHAARLYGKLPCKLIPRFLWETWLDNPPVKEKAFEMEK